MFGFKTLGFPLEYFHSNSLLLGFLLSQYSPHYSNSFFTYLGPHLANPSKNLYQMGQTGLVHIVPLPCYQ